MTAHCDGNSSVNSKESIEIMTKWLLDTGTSIHAEKNRESVLNKKLYNSTVNIDDRNSSKPRGVGTK
jgi:hypothetical protein